MHSVDHSPPSRQRGPHNDPHLLDGDSAHGTSDVEAGDEWAVDTDTDVLDDSPADPLEEAVADPLPETEEELEAFTAGVDRDTPADEPPVEARHGLPDTDDEEEKDSEDAPVEADATDVAAKGDPPVTEEDETEDEVDAEDETAADEDDASEVDEADDRGAELDDADMETASVGEGTTAEAEVDRQMAVTSTPPAEPAREVKRGRSEPVGMPPMPDYLTLTVPQVLDRAKGMDAGEVARVLEFEQVNRNRKTLVAKLSKLARTAE